jgi:hypothetical protein
MKKPDSDASEKAKKKKEPLSLFDMTYIFLIAEPLHQLKLQQELIKTQPDTI